MNIDVKELPVVAANDRVLRFPEVVERTGLCRSAIHDLVSRGLFPTPFKLVPGGRASGFLESEINDYIARRVKDSRGGGKK